MAGVGFAEESAHVLVEGPGGMIVRVAAAEKLVETPAAAFGCEQRKDAPSQPLPLIAGQKIQGVEADLKVLVLPAGQRPKVGISHAVVSVHRQVHPVFRIFDAPAVLFRVPGKVERVDPFVGIDAPIGGRPGFLPGPGQQGRILSSGRAKRDHRSSSSAAQIASSRSRICFFISPSSTWS